jgi:hypothetical protein
MKIPKFLAFLILFLLAVFSAQAQIPNSQNKETDNLTQQILGIMDDTNGMILNVNQKTKLKENNKSFLDQVMKIAAGTDSEERKKSSFLDLKNNRINFLTKLLGNELAQKYMGYVIKEIKPLKSKLGLAALAF